MLRQLLSTTFVILFFLGINNNTNATHIMGGEITWECQPDGRYVFQFSVYRDCSGNPLDVRGPLVIFNYPSVGQSRVLASDGGAGALSNYNAPGNIVSNRDISPNCTGAGSFSCANRDPQSVFEQIRKTDPIRLNGSPPTQGWIITYDDVARNGNDNIQGQPGMTLRAKIYPSIQTQADSCLDNSPKFRELATSLLCPAIPFKYNHNATDDELDSLVYEWAEPLNAVNPAQSYNEGVNPTFVGFQSNYTFNSPFPGLTQDVRNVPATLDPATGEISLTSFTQGKFVSVVKVTAFKCGQRVAEIYRELQSNISPSPSCANNDQPTVRPPFQDASNNFTLFNDTVQAGDLVQFNIQIQDLTSIAQVGGDSVTLTATGAQFGTNFTSATGCARPPCATLTSTLPQSGFLGVSSSFRWQTDCIHTSSSDFCVDERNTYTFVITAVDNRCPQPLKNVATISVTVLADSVIESPLLHCVDVLPNGDVNVDWNTTPDPGNSFSAWMLYSATDINGPYQLVDSIKVYNQTSYTHTGANAQNQRRFYFIRSRSGCKGSVQNIALDTVSTIFVDPVSTSNQVDVIWNPVSIPNPSGMTSYDLYREFPIGGSFNLFQSTTNTQVADTGPRCDDNVRYRVELINTVEACTSRSNTVLYEADFPEPQTNFSFLNNQCAGQSISFNNLTTVSSGTVNYTWNFGDGVGTSTQANPSYIYVNPGVYNVTLNATTIKGCDSVLTQQITISLPNVDAGADQFICPSGSVQIGGSPTSTTAGVTYLWNNGVSLSSTTIANPISTPSTTTTYTVTVTDANNCTSTDQVTVNVVANPIADAGVDQNVCLGSGVLIGGAPTGPPTASYAWDNSASLDNAAIANPTASPTVTTTYTVTVTAGVNCTATDQVTITVVPVPTADAGLDQSICPGGSIGIGGSPTASAGSTILWDNASSLSNASSTNPIATPLTTTTYTVTVTDVNNCTAVDQVLVTVNPPPSTNAGPDQTICFGSSVSVGGAPTGPAGSTFTWDNPTSLNNTTIANPIASPTTTTTYTVTVTDLNNCTNTDQITVTVAALPTADAGTDQSLCIGSSLSIGGAPTGPTGATYLWDNGATLSNVTAANPVASPLVTTTYTVTVTAGVNCTNTDQVTITVDPLPSVDAGNDQTICPGSSTSIGGSPTGPSGSTYVWDNGASLNGTSLANPIASPTVTTTYTVTVTDGNLCTATDQVTITVNPLPAADAGADQDICIGGSTTIGGSPTGPAGVTFAWDNGVSLSSTTIANPIASPIVTTTYTVTITDLNSCTNIDQVTVTVNPLPTADAGIDQIICDGQSATIGGAPTGPPTATYTWDNGATLSSTNTANPIATPTATTTYSVTVSDGNNCTAVDQVTITVNPIPNVDAGADQVICNLGSVTIGGSPTSSTPGATYLWDNSATLSSSTVANPTASPIVTTTYTVTVTHPNLCTSTDQVIVTVNPLPNADAGADQDICIGSSATIGGSPTGPIGATYVWDNGGSLNSTTTANPIATPTVTTTYSVTVTDGNLCTAVDQLTITVNPLPTVDAGADQTICAGELVAIGGSPTTTAPGAIILWSNASISANQTVSPTVTTTYTVTVTDGNLCTATDQVTITVNPLPAADAGADQDICIGGNTTIGGSPTGPAGVTFSWDNGASLSSTTIANPIASPTVTTTYTVTITDVNSCTNTDQVTVTVNPLPVADAGIDQTICDGQSATIGGAPTGPPTATYTWDNGGSLSSTTIANPIATPTVTTTYSVTVSDGNNCTAVDQVTITVNPAPNVDAGADQVICNLGSVTIGGSPTSSTPGATYLWDNSATLSSSTVANPIATPTVTTTYTVTVTHPNLCTSTDQVIVTVNPLPNADAGADQDICIGSSAIIGGSPTGPIGATYVWDNGGSLNSTTTANPIATPTVTTTYSVTVTDGNLCTAVDQVTITVNPLPTVDAGADQTICDGQSVTIGGSPTSSTPGATFAWDNGATLSSATGSNPIATPSVTTTYTITVTDANLCTATDQVTITVNPLPAVDAGIDQTICDGQSVSIGGSPTGPGGVTFAWDNGVSLSSTTIGNPIASPIVTTTYTVTITDANSCTNTDQVTVTVNPLPTADAGIDQTICDGQSATIGGAPTGPPTATYTWDNGGSLSSTTIANPIATPTVTTTYSVTVSDGNNCTAVDQVTVTVNPIPNVDAGLDRSICNAASIVIGGSPTSSTPGATYLWDNSATLSSSTVANPTASPIVTTTYTVTVTHPNLCTATDQVIITVNPLPVADAGVDQDICIGSSTSIGGTPTGPTGSTFNWDNGATLSSTTIANPVASPTITTTYSVTVTDGNLCTGVDQVTVTVNPLPTVDAGLDQTICNGQNVSIGGTPTGPTGSTFAWDNGASLSSATIANPIASPTVTTTYTVTVTDANNCTNTDQVIVTVNPLPTTDAGIDQSICLGSAVTIGGTPTGPPTAIYSWDNGASLSSTTIANPIASPTATTTYTVTVTDGNNCTNTDQVVVTVNPLPVADAGIDQTICDGQSATIGGAPTGPPTATYIWDNGSSLSNTTVANPIATPITTTTYSVTVTDGNNCTAVDQMTVNVNPIPNAEAGTEQTICQNDTVTIGGSPTGPSGATYLWSPSTGLSDPSVANPLAFPLDTTEYFVTIVDINGCRNTDSVTINVNPTPAVNFDVNGVCEGDFTGFTDVSTLQSGSIQSWSWDFGDGIGTSILQNPAYQYGSPGTYSVQLIVISDLGCIDSLSKDVVVNPLPLVDAGIDQEICERDSITLGGNPTGPSGSLYSWSPANSLSDVSSANPIAKPLMDTRYTLSVTDNNGCVNFDTIDITVNPLPIVLATEDTFVCANTVLQLNASGAQDYNWTPTTWLNNPQIANPIATPRDNIEYIVFGTDINGCISSDTVSISVFNISFEPSDTSVCYGDSVQLNPIIQSGDPLLINYVWSPSGGMNNPNLQNPKVSPSIDQEYKLRVTDQNGCFDVDSIFVEVLAIPDVNFEYKVSPRCENAVIEIMNISTNSDNFQWILNGEPYSREMNPEFPIDFTVENTIQLIGFNDNCSDTIEQIIPATSFDEIFAFKDANVFTPNGDGINDIFDPGFEGEYIGCVNFRIYDRWGEKVFDSNIGQYGWDGRTLRGVRSQTGTYFYIINIAGKEIRGSVYLSR